MPLPNKNRRKKAKQMKRDERRGHIRLSFVDIYVPSRLHSHLSSFVHATITQNDIGSMVYKRGGRIFDSLKGKAKKCLGANIIFTSSIF